MLELVHDTRTGKRMEIVIPTFNEESRIVGIINYYAPDFDVVLLDDDSTDNTQQRAIDAGGSVFRRTVKHVLGEAHFAYYVNMLTRSGRVFYLFADEFVPLAQMQQVEQHLLSETSFVLSRRVDWLYGARLNVAAGGMPRGFRRGSAVWVEGSIHSALRGHGQDFSKGQHYSVDVHHLHVTLASQQYGSTGRYAALEIADFRKSRWPFLRFLRRFFISEVVLLPRKLWRERDKPWIIRAQWGLLKLTTACIGLLCWIEARYLPGLEDQREIYAGFYHRDPKSEDQDKTQDKKS